MTFDKAVGVSGIEALAAAFGDFYVSRARVVLYEYGEALPALDAATGSQDLDLHANRCFSRRVSFDRVYVVHRASVNILEWGCGEGGFGGPALRFAFLGCQ